jgi:hypothetical protein
MKLNQENVPKPLRPLLPIAERWGIGDDFDREAAVAKASRSELESLVRCIDGISDDDLFGWLSGAQAMNPSPSAEYVAITCLVMAIDSAKLKLKRNDPLREG